MKGCYLLAGACHQAWCPRPLLSSYRARWLWVSFKQSGGLPGEARRLQRRLQWKQVRLGQPDIHCRCTWLPDPYTAPPKEELTSSYAGSLLQLSAVSHSHNMTGGSYHQLALAGMHTAYSAALLLLSVLCDCLGWQSCQKLHSILLFTRLVTGSLSSKQFESIHARMFDNAAAAAYGNSSCHW